MPVKSVLLLGATGQIGLFALPRLIEAGIRVTAVSRDPRAGRQPRRGDLRWLHADDMFAETGLAAADALLSCGPVELAARAVSAGARFDRAIVFSTSSVYTKEDSADHRERAQVRHILAAEARLRESCAAAGAPLALLRPTLVYGCGMDRSISYLFRWIRRFGFVPLAGDAKGLRQPVHAEDLAIAAAVLTTLPDAVELDSPIRGGSTLTYREMVEKLFGVLGRKPRIVSLPPRLLYAVAKLAGAWPGRAGIRGAMVLRQENDLVFDDSELTELLDFSPRKFSPGVCDFSVPEYCRMLQPAGN